MSKKLLLVDGHSMINRAFYGVPPLTNSKGLHTNAVFGFLNILISVLDEEKPDYIMVAFDLKAKTFRHKIYEAYKGTRKPMPQELHEQVPVVKELLKAMGITIMSKEGYEADDILGTMSVRAEKKGMEVCILSGDRDLLQLATKKVKIRMPHTKAGKTESEDFYESDVLNKYQVMPKGIIELKALMGDSSDNIPGVPKIGEKTATELIKEYGNIENLKEHISEISKKSVRETLENNFELAELSKVLATIDTDADIAYEIEESVTGDIYTKEAYELVSSLEFKNILNRFNLQEVDTFGAEAESFKYVDDLSEAEVIFETAINSDTVGAELIAENGRVLGMSLSCSDENTCYVKTGGFITEGYIKDKFVYILKNAKRVVTFDIKKQLHYLNTDFTYRSEIKDILLMLYLLNPLKSDYEPEDAARERLGIPLLNKKQMFAKNKLSELAEDCSAEFLKYACYHSYSYRKSYDELCRELSEKEMLSLYEDIELPLIYVLYDIERTGIGVDENELREYGLKLTGRINELEKSIYDKAGEEFNINSPKQLGEILFEKLKLKGGKKTKTGYSTAADVLEKLAADVPLVADVLEYRGLTKLKSTYADGLLPYIEADGRIRSTFHQTITATGRLSSADPNLQNIPVRTELGRMLRHVFKAKEGCVFIDADYSQIELRLMACMSGDEKLISAYNMEQDIHRITAAEVFHIPFDEVTPLQRRNAKAVNFGIIYGISSFGLSQDLSISRSEAKEYIDNYFKTYKTVKIYLDNLVECGKNNGYVKTLFGRRRPVPELSGGNFMQRQFGERVCMNAPVQGTAADIMKIAMINVAKRLKLEGCKACIVLQVHDELLIEAPVQEKDLVIKLLCEEMMNAAQLPVPLSVEAASGNTWYEAH